MATLSRDALKKRPFADRKNYPYGFSRSGDFSIMESKMLQMHGSLIAALVDGDLTPENEEEMSYLEAALGHQPPKNSTEKAWVKYQTRINRPKTASIYGAKNGAASDDDDDATITEDSDDIDIDIDED